MTIPLLLLGSPVLIWIMAVIIVQLTWRTPKPTDEDAEVRHLLRLCERHQYDVNDEHLDAAVESLVELHGYDPRGYKSSLLRNVGYGWADYDETMARFHEHWEPCE